MWEREEEEADIYSGEEEAPALTAKDEDVAEYFEPLDFPSELSELQAFYDEGGIDGNEAMHLYAKWASKEISAEEVIQELEEVYNYPGENPVDTVDNSEQEDVFETEDERTQKTA